MGKTITSSIAMRETSLDRQVDKARGHKEVALMDHNTVNNHKAVGNSTVLTVALTSKKELRMEASPS